jgi:hypothetical protein
MPWRSSKRSIQMIPILCFGMISPAQAPRTMKIQHRQLTLACPPDLGSEKPRGFYEVFQVHRVSTTYIPILYGKVENSEQPPCPHNLALLFSVLAINARWYLGDADIVYSRH